MIQTLSLARGATSAYAVHAETTRSRKVCIQQVHQNFNYSRKWHESEWDADWASVKLAVAVVSLSSSRIASHQRNCVDATRSARKDPLQGGRQKTHLGGFCRCITSHLYS